jgi:hypothetical protein
MGLRDLTVNLRNFLIYGEDESVTVLSRHCARCRGSRHGDREAPGPMVWGSDPIHPSPAAYRLLAAKIAERVGGILNEPASTTPNQGAKRKADLHDAWVAGSQSVAKRTGLQQTRRGGQSRGAARAKQ